MAFAAGVTTHVVVVPDKAEPGTLPLTDKVCSGLCGCALLVARFAVGPLACAVERSTPALCAHPSRNPAQVRAAQAAGVPVVHPDWIVACRFAWRRLPEAAFRLTTYKGAAASSSSSSAARLLGMSQAGSRKADAAAERAAVMQSAGRVG
jgi:hypothetical protein